MAQPPAQIKAMPSRNGTGYLFALTFTLLSLTAVYAIRIVAIQSGVSEKMDQITANDKFIEHPMLLRTTYTGVAPVDKFLSTLVAAFMNGAAGWDESFFVEMVYFLVSFFSIISVWAVESCRSRNSWALMSFTYVFALFYQTVGGAIVIPIYYLAYLYDTSDNSYWTKSRHVPLSYAKALLPALTIGYLLPTLLLFLPYSSPNMWTTQAMVALWQPCPWFVDILIWVFSRLSSNGASDSKTHSRSDDVPYLQRIYALCFLVTAATHLATAYLCLFSPNPNYSFQNIFVRPMLNTGEEMTLLQGLFAIFQADFWIIFVSGVLAALLAILDLKRVGIARDVAPVQVGLLLSVASVVVGPAAVVAAVWYWREDRMARAEAEVAKKR